MEISRKLKERFVKDYKIPIKMFDEPYFTDRICLFNEQYDSIDKWTKFVDILLKYDNEEQYFEEYNSVKDKAIDFIKSTEAYNRFNNEDQNQYAIKNNGYSSKDIFHPMNIGKRFMSIDMRKANFNSLRHYDKSIFNNAETWEDFMRNFTSNEHIINSKYIREVILGNCNPKRHINYEKHLMDEFLTYLINKGVPSDKIVFFSNDEIIIDITDTEDYIPLIEKYELYPIFRIDIFTLKSIKENNVILGYIKDFGDGKYDIKGINHIHMPFVIRTLNNEPITDRDMIFEYENQLAKFMNPITIEIE